MAKYSKSSEETENIFNKLLAKDDVVSIIEKMVEGDSIIKNSDYNEESYNDEK